MTPKNYNPTGTNFLKGENHPHNEIIEKLRSIILISNSSLEENIKWNGPNYSIGGEDRITMRLFPPKSFQLRTKQLLPVYCMTTGVQWTSLARPPPLNMTVLIVNEGLGVTFDA